MTQSVLLLGSGFVAKPCLDNLAEAGIHTTVGKKIARPRSRDGSSGKLEEDSWKEYKRKMTMKMKMSGN